MSQSAIAFKSSVMGPNSRTGSSVECRGTATQWLDAPTSIPAALGNTISSSRVRIAIVCSKIDNERPRHGKRRIRLDLLNGMRIAALTNVTDESRTMLINGLVQARTNAGSVMSALPFAF
ncbi:MAG: hypothetical protein ACRC2B_23785 [Rubrivivax sp.]